MRDPGQALSTCCAPTPSIATAPSCYHSIPYRDPSCAHPTRSLMARGNLTLGRPSWITPGGTEAEYTLSKVEVMGHSHQDATKLALAVNATCPGKITKPWKPHKAYVVLSYAEAANEVTEDEDCSRGLGGAWNELQLLRVEVTMQGHDAGTAAAATREEAQQEDTGGGSGMKSPKIIRKELFLGDLHTDSSKQELYRPTGYQTPLLHAKYAGACGGVCKAVERGTDDSPPHLHASPALPLLLAGSWASRRCETRPYGMFLTRHLEFSPTGHRWTMTLRHYHDPECTRPSFTLQASGTHRPATILPSPASPRHTFITTYAHDFNVTRLLLTPEDEYLSRALNMYNNVDCGVQGSWVRGEAQDVTPTGGCAAVGVQVPAVKKEIVRTGVDETGRMWLALGQTPTAKQLSGARRPTSWGPELTSCRSYHAYHHDNTLLPIVGARTASSASAKHTLPACTTLLALLVLLAAPHHR
ncbi:protein APCDD1-like [Scylla paramamosain]|uniref:protein APCDD1-like n=1 Tax=Scylla paramamosain TaxID=85552 RepID=UPI0030827CA7